MGPPSQGVAMHRLPLAATFAAAFATAAAAQIVTASPTYLDAKGKLTAVEMQSTFAGKYREEGVDAAGNSWSVTSTATGALTVTAGTPRPATGQLWAGRQARFGGDGQPLTPPNRAASAGSTPITSRLGSSA